MLNKWMAIPMAILFAVGSIMNFGMAIGGVFSVIGFCVMAIILKD